jgi:hypothetical protein
MPPNDMPPEVFNLVRTVPGVPRYKGVRNT